MYKIKGRIKGVAPILFNSPTESTLSDIDTGSSGGKKTSKQRMDEAYNKMHRNGHGIYIEPWTFKKCLMNGAIKGKLKEKNSGLAPYLEATVFVDGELLFGKNEPDRIHEAFGKVPPGPKGKGVIVRRPQLDTGWELPFALNVMDDNRNPEQIRKALDYAGLYCGLGSWRPEHGRFIVAGWEALHDSR